MVDPSDVTTAQSLMWCLMLAYKEWASEASSLLVIIILLLYSQPLNSFFRDVDGTIIMFDVTNKQSLVNALSDSKCSKVKKKCWLKEVDYKAEDDHKPVKLLGIQAWMLLYCMLHNHDCEFHFEVPVSHLATNHSAFLLKNQVNLDSIYSLKKVHTKF